MTTTSINDKLAHTGRGAERITASDSTVLAPGVRGINVATAGLVYVDTQAGDTNVPVYIAAGGVFPLSVTRVYATGTTAADITVIR